MSKIRFNETTSLTTEQFVTGLTDFGPDREKVFSKSADDCLKVQALGLAEDHGDRGRKDGTVSP